MFPSFTATVKAPYHTRDNPFVFTAVPINMPVMSSGMMYKSAVSARPSCFSRPADGDTEHMLKSSAPVVQQEEIITLKCKETCADDSCSTKILRCKRQ